MKKQIKYIVVIVIISLLISFLPSSYAQSVVVEMSIEYNCDHSYQIDSMVKVPYLVVRYKNMSDSCFYLPKITFTDETLPCMGAVLLSSCNTNMDAPKTQLYQQIDFSDSVFIVSVNQLWNLYSNNTLINDEDEANVSLLANTVIEDYRQVLTNTYTKLRFVESEINSNTILSDNSNYFVHLEPNQIHTDRYCLGLFEALGGQYEFRLSPQYSSERVQRETDFSCMVESKLSYIELPKKVNEYYLFQDDLLCNSVRVTFRSNNESDYGIEGTYKMEGGFSLILYDGYYALDLDSSFDDVVSFDRLSLGKYVIDGDTITLKDALLNYLMELKIIDEQKILCVKSFHTLNEKAFVFDHEVRQFDWDRIILDYESHTKDICVHWHSDTTFVCDTGWYVWKDFSRHGTDFQLKEDGHFEFTIGDMVFLSGCWNQVGNLLVFKDDIIAEPFYAVIEEDGIVPFLPNILGLWKYHYYDERENEKD